MRPLNIRFLGSPSASVSAALTENITDEDDIAAGGNTITLVLTGDTFVTGTSSEDGIAAGSNSSLAGTGTSWNSLVKSDLDNTDVVISTTTVTNDTATITLPAYGTYDISETETITWTIPAASLTSSGSPVVASPTFTIDAVVTDVIFQNLLHPIHAGIIRSSAAGLNGVLVT